MTGNCLMPGPLASYLPQNPVTQTAKICVSIMTGSSLFTSSRLSAPKILSNKSMSITTASIIKPAPYLVSAISNIPTHPAMRPTVETVEEEDDAPSTAPLVNTPYIVEQLFHSSAAALSQNALPAASPVTAPVSVQTPTFQSDIAADKRRANDHSADATPRTTLSPSPEPFRPAPPPYENLH
ncbi:hypothetical protein C8R44DRAFT_749900 [Mycena epipterygia]|nr:hypothetical protein C8R44DRAFT_749900 [Mycena epipterygia]